MAARIAIIGDPNSGKSFSRRFIKDGENCFLITPSVKGSHLTKTNGENVSQFNVSIGTFKNLTEVANNIGLTGSLAAHNAIRAFQKKGLPKEATVVGNYAIVPNLKYLIDYLLFIDKYMPHIHTIFIGDFTHYITNIISGNEFRSRTSGGAAFERFYDLAADTLHGVILSTDELTRQELVVVTEYHAIYDADRDVNKIFVPAGKMLSEKFLPESYYDYVAQTYIVSYDEEKDDSKRFKFVITRRGKYDGRMAGLFPEANDGMIPNDMSLVLERVRKDLGISLINK